MKKAVSFLLAAIIIAVQLSVGLSVLPLKADATEIDYKCGDNATWYLDTDGVLTISGTGSTYEYSNNAPWELYSSSIYSVKVEEGITRLGQHAFYNCKKIKSVHLAASVETVHFSALPSSVEEITVADNSMLTEFRMESDYFMRSNWYKNQPADEPIYLGRMLVGIPSSFSSEYVEIKEGTYAVNMKAFTDSAIVGFTFPDSLSSVGWKAFEGTAWFDSLPDGPVYAGNVFLKYKGILPLEERNYAVPEGTTGIAARAFCDQDRLNKIIVPSSVKYIGYDAFNGCVNLNEVSFSDNAELIELDTNAFCGCKSLKNIVLPDSLQIIDGGAFSKTSITELYIPQNVKVIYNNIGNIDTASSISRYAVDENSVYFCNDEYGVLYSKDMTLLYDYPRCADIDEYTVNSNCKRIKDRAFYGTSGTVSLVINDGCEVIEGWQFNSGSIDKITVPASVKSIDSVSVTYNQTIYCYENSYAHEYAVEKQISYVLIEDVADCEELKKLISSASEIDRGLFTQESLAELDTVLDSVDLEADGLTQEQVAEWETAIETAIKNLDYLPADYSSVEEAKNRAKGIDRTLYTPESLAELDEALAAVDYDLTIDKQSQVAEWVSAIETAIENLDYLPADYSSVEEAKNRAEEIDRTLYTPESLAELDEALAAVDYDLTVDKQSQVAEWVSAIETAIENLEYLPADYSSVEAQLDKVNALDRRYYSEVSLLALENAVNSIEYNLNITEQEKVNEYAGAVADALAKLQYASIVLRHEPCGIIVSATTKEIKPDTALTAQEVDPSNYEGTNFAVGGSIRSLHFYDINLVLKGEKVQPKGKVTVKIKLADGVNPAKCKVYHVTEDIVNPLVRFASTIDGNYIVFETTHFSEFAVIEVETVLDGIEIAQQPDKTDYIAGESLDTDGMKVVAKFSDGTSREISDYTVGMVNLNTAGKHKVTVYYTFGSITKTAEFEVNVTAKEIKADITENGKSTDFVNKKLGLFSLYSKAAIQLDCDVRNADGCTLRWSSDNSKVMVDENGRVTCKGLFGAKKANITLEVVDGNGNVVASDTVRVVFYKLSFQLSNALSQAIKIFGREY